MAFHVRDPKTDRVVRELARKTGTSLTEAVRSAASEKLAAMEKAEAMRDTRPLRDRVKDIQDRVAARGRSGLAADKEFYDWLSGEE